MEISSATDLLAQQTSMLQAKVAMAAATKVLNVQKQMGEDIVALLDPNKGTRLNVSA